MSREQIKTRRKKINSFAKSEIEKYNRAAQIFFDKQADEAKKLIDRVGLPPKNTDI